MAESSEILRATMHDLRHFAALLRGVNIGNRATVTVTQNGLTVLVEEARTLLAKAFIFNHIFDEYVYTPPQPERPPTSQTTDNEVDEEPVSTVFEVPLNTLIDCLNIFGTAGPSATTSTKLRKWRGDGADADTEDDAPAGRRAADRLQNLLSGGEKGTGMRMSYAGPGYPLMLVIAEDASGPTTTCEITTFDPEPHLELPFVHEDTVLRIILKSPWLREALSELDPSCEKVTFIGTPRPAPAAGRSAGKRRTDDSKPMLRIRAKGMFGTTEMDYPDDRDVLETFECETPISFSYRLAHLTRTLRALASSTKTSFRMDGDGLLSLQFLMPSPRPGAGMAGARQDAFVDFVCLPLDEEV